MPRPSFAPTAELETARQQRQKAEEELARLKAEIEARRLAEQGSASRRRRPSVAQPEEVAQRKAETEMAALRQAEAEAQKKAAAEAQAKKQADEALAKAQAERQAGGGRSSPAGRGGGRQAQGRPGSHRQRRGGGQAEDRRRACCAEGRRAGGAQEAAEAAEIALRLATADRQRLQVALSSLGFDTRGIDGAFGSRSREMIAAWQKAHDQPPTGFLSGSQQLALLNEAAPAVSNVRGRAEEDRGRQEENRGLKRRQARAGIPPAAATTAFAISAARGAGSRHRRQRQKPRNDNRPIEEKRVLRREISGLAGCAIDGSYSIRVFQSRIELNVGGWRKMPLDNAGNFTSGVFTTSNGVKFVVNGTMSPRDVHRGNLDRVCSWKATF